MRQIVLDTETTGLEVALGHRVIEIGCVELVDRKLTKKHFHQYVNPERDIDDGAQEVHGISREFLSDKPLFKDIWEPFLEFVSGAELIIHNAPFDVGFLNHEMKFLHGSHGRIEDYCQIIDSLAVARQKHPGQKNNLDALCKRYLVDNSQRDLHGALLDAEILADVYLLMTGGQVALSLSGEDDGPEIQLASVPRTLDANRPALKVIRATEAELDRHEAKLNKLDAASGGSVWRQQELV
ncbi:MAG: DNA polymerase-3 subunit epsilon [Candidatus Azotimanducaceae bacterium]|jgi:DNA polymerase-3 subunit epsilon